MSSHLESKLIYPLSFNLLLGGYYCSTPGLGQEDGLCSDGFYCEYGVDVATPSGSHTGVGGICPEGSYCPRGSAIPLECEAGTYTSSPGKIK